MHDELTPEHEISYCTRKSDYEDMRPNTPTCAKVVELEGIIAAMRNDIEDIKETLRGNHKR